VTERLPLFALGSVLFPGLVLSLRVFEDRYRQMIRDIGGGTDRRVGEFGVVAIRRGWEVERGAPGMVTGPEGGRNAESVNLSAPTASLTLYEIGCTAEIRQLTEHPDGRFDLVAVGRRRFRITSIDAQSRPYLSASVEWLPESVGPPGAAESLAPSVLAAFQRYLQVMQVTTPGSPGEQLPDDPTVLSHMVAATAALTLDDRQQLLAMPDTATRLRAERRLLNREARLLSRVRAVPVPLAELAVASSPN
jgi:Lon protease-like protein